MQANRLLVPIIAIILLTTLFAGLVSVSATAQLSTTPLSAKSTVDTVNAQASQKKYVIFRDDDIAPFSLNLHVESRQSGAYQRERTGVASRSFRTRTQLQHGERVAHGQPLLNYLLSNATNPLFDFTQHGYNHHINGVDSSLASGGLYPNHP